MDNFENEVIGVLHRVLGLDAASVPLIASSPLLGVVTELDSMTVVAVLGALEDLYGISIADDEVDGATFATVASLAALVRSKRET